MQLIYLIWQSRKTLFDGINYRAFSRKKIKELNLRDKHFLFLFEKSKIPGKVNSLKKYIFISYEQDS